MCGGIQSVLLGVPLGTVFCRNVVSTVEQGWKNILSSGTVGNLENDFFKHIEISE